MIFLSKSYFDTFGDSTFSLFVIFTASPSAVCNFTFFIVQFFAYSIAPRFQTNIVVVIVNVAVLHENIRRRLNVHAVCEPQDALDIFGTNGSIHVPVLNRGETVIKSKNGERVENHPPHQNVHQPLIEDFVEAILNNREPLLNGEIGKTVAQIEMEIYEKRW